MSDGEDELEKIRQRKRERLKQRANGEPANAGGTDDAGDAGGEEPPAEPIHIDSETHLEEVLDSYETVLVDCYADWCGPCQMMEPTIQSLAAETEAAVAKVDVDANQRLAQQLGAQGVPTFVVYSGGEPIKRLVGAQDRATLEALLQRGS